MILINEIDEIPKDIILSKSQIDAIKQRKMCEKGNLDSQLKLKIGDNTIVYQKKQQIWFGLRKNKQEESIKRG